MSEEKLRFTKTNEVQQNLTGKTEEERIEEGRMFLKLLGDITALGYHLDLKFFSNGLSYIRPYKKADKGEIEPLGTISFQKPKLVEKMQETYNKLKEMQK